MKTRINSRFCITVFLCLLGLSAYANVWDLAADWNPPANPNGPWSYGQISGAGGTFTPLPWTSFVTDHTAGYYGEAGKAEGNVSQNTASWANYGINPGQIYLESDYGSAAVQWTAPATGHYEIVVAMGGTTSPETGPQGQDADQYGNYFAQYAGLDVNGVIQTGSFANNVMSWSLDLTLTGGSTIDAYVINPGYANGGSTQTEFTVTSIPDSNTNGNENTASGNEALSSDTTGSKNSAFGIFALASNTTGNRNTACGYQALLDNTTGNENSAFGTFALASNIIGVNNAASGYKALLNNTTGNSNTASGSFALYQNTSGSNNTASGLAALNFNTTGDNNTANGYRALNDNTTGSNNIALGFGAGSNLTTGSDNIDIFDPGNAGESDTIRIGTAGVQTNAFMAGISGATVAEGVAVYVDANGQLGTLTSSRRFKEDIQPMDKASEAILALQPVSFRYKHELDPQGIPQFGLVAEEVEKLAPDLVARDAQGKAYTVRYEAVNAMLLNEFLKEHRRVEQQKTEMQDLKSRLEKLEQLLNAKNGGGQFPSEH
jgi:hypothetical protein